MTALHEGILADHAELRRLLRTLSRRVARLGNGPVPEGVREVVDRLGAALTAHHRREREGLCARLRGGGVHGGVLADHVEAMHRYQQEWLRDMRRALADGRSGLEIGVRAFALAQVLGDDLAQEERWLGHLAPSSPVAQVA